MDLKSQVGKKSKRFTEPVTEERLARFCEAVGMAPSREAPPTFLTCFRHGEFDLFDQLGIPLSNVLHAEQEYTLDAPVRAGDSVSFETSMTKVLEKTGSSGSMSFMTFKTDFFVHETPVASSCTTIVVRR